MMTLADSLVLWCDRIVIWFAVVVEREENRCVENAER